MSNPNPRELVQKPFGGPIQIGYVRDGIWTPTQDKDHNLVLYGGSDILGRLAAGDPSYFINHMYFEFSNAVPPAVVPLPGEGQSYYAGLGGTEDFVRAPISFTPNTSASGIDFVSNVTEFFGVTAGATGYHGLPFSQAAGSQVYGAALVSTPTSDFVGDVVFARFYFTTPVTVVNGSQIGVDWHVQF